MCFLLLGYRLKPRPNSHVLGTVGSVMTICLSINRCSHSAENQFDERERTGLTSPELQFLSCNSGRSSSLLHTKKDLRVLLRVWLSSTSTSCDFYTVTNKFYLTLFIYAQASSIPTLDNSFCRREIVGFQPRTLLETNKPDWFKSAIFLSKLVFN